jgi:opacity protein-like surface antigen
MKHRRLASIVLAVVLCSVLGAAHAWSESSIVLPRPGQVGIEGHGGYGTLTAGGDLGQQFGSGYTIGVRLRYRMRYERAVGLVFDSQQFDVRVPQPVDPLNPVSTQLTFVTAGIEMYQMFGTRTKTPRMIMAGAGIAQASAKQNDGDTQFPGDGQFASVGAGMEYFFYRSIAWDASARYLAVFHDGHANHDLQASIGIIMYASY